MLWLVFFASLCFIGLKSWQQQNVTHEKYWWIPPTSMAMAWFELYVIAKVAQEGHSAELVLAVGAGAGIGSVFATWLHKRIRER